MLRIIFTILAAIGSFLTHAGPGLWLIGRLRRRDGLKWGLPAMLIAVPYFAVAGLCQILIEAGSTRGLHLPMFWCLIMGISYLVLGPVTLVKLLNARCSEAQHTRRTVIAEAESQLLRPAKPQLTDNQSKFGVAFQQVTAGDRRNTDQHAHYSALSAISAE